MRRADKAQAKPILKYARIPTAPSKKPVYVLCVVLVALLLSIPVAQKLYGDTVSSECGRTK